MEWIEQALCRQVDPDLFVGDGNSAEIKYKAQKAKAICKHCPVIDDCRAYAITLAKQGQIHGIWAGMTDRDIHRLVARERAA